MAEPAETVLPETDRELTRLAADHQREHRVPGMLAATARNGKVLWHKGIGSANLTHPGQPHDLDTQVQVASNTKTFTAVMVMQLRDEGRLHLSDTVDQLIPGSRHERVTVRQLLSHTTGMQREPVGDVWDTLDFPDREQLVAGWDDAERVLPDGTYWHYSNLGYAILGEIVARLDGGTWEESLQRRLLDPLELRRTGLTPTPPTAGRYYVAPYTDVPVEEPLVDKRATGAAGALWSTATDMAAWHAFLADPDESVLAADTLEEMCQPQVVADPRGWSLGWGLGLELVRRDGRTWVGHTGGLPGSITGFFTHRDSGTTGMALMNASVAGDPAAFASTLGATLLDREPPEPEPWTPGTELPPDLVPLVGRWFSEGSGFTFSIRDGRLEARLDRAPADAPPSVFERTGDDAFVTVSGRERGERLVVRRAEDWSVRQLSWATYRFTREPLGFGEPTP